MQGTLGERAWPAGARATNLLLHALAAFLAYWVAIRLGAPRSVAALLMAAIFGWALNSRGMPKLELWHSAGLPSQFERSDIESMSGLEDYLQREDQLFEELHEQARPPLKRSATSAPRLSLLAARRSGPTLSLGIRACAL